MDFMRLKRRHFHFMPSLIIHVFFYRQSPEVFCKKGVLKSFAIFTEKHLCWSPFSIKLQAFMPVTFFKKNSDTGFFV